MLNNYPLLDKFEKANVVSHGMALLLFIFILPFLIIKSNNHSLQLLGSAAFALGVVTMYLSSTIYHLAIDGKLKFRLRQLDHISIFLLIGGSYTAFILRYYATESGLYFLGLHWVLIIAGVIAKLFLTGKWEVISTICYVLLGWMVVWIYEPITANMSVYALTMLALGGAFYTIGVIFYIWHRLPYHHCIWHIFVLGGSLSHFLSLYYG